MRTATAQSGRASERSAHKIAEKMTGPAGGAFGDWIEDAIREYADDLGVDPLELTERERLEAIEEFVDRQARAAAVAPRAKPEDDARPAWRRREAAERADAPRPKALGLDARERGRPANPRNAESAAEAVALDDAVERIEARARRLNPRDGAEREGSEAAQSRLEHALADVEQRAERNAERTARAVQALADLVEKRGADRDRLGQTIEDIQKRAERSERHTARALESLSGLIDARVGDRQGLEAAIERIAHRAEQSERRTARALETLMATVKQAAPEASRTVEPPRADAVAARLDALARRAAGAPEAQTPATPSAAASDDETFRLVAERLARRRRDRQEPVRENLETAPEAAPAQETSAVADMQRQLLQLAQKVDSLAVPPPPATPRAEAKPAEPVATTKDATLERMERQLATLAERIEREPRAAPNPTARDESEPRAAAFQGLERRLDELGARFETAARQSTPDARPLEDLARRVETIRASIERQGARPDGAPLLAALAHLNDKLDRASANGSQSAATMVALQGMIGRLEEALQRPTATPIDPRPIEELARRIDSVRGLVERQGSLAPIVDQIHAAVGQMQQKLDRPVTPNGEIERLEAALRDLSAEVHAIGKIEAPDMKPVEELARRIDAMRKAVETNAAPGPQSERLERAVADIRARLDRPANSQQIEAVDAALRQLAAKFDEAASRPATVALDPKPVEELALRIEAMRKAVESNGALAPQAERWERALADIGARLDRPDNSKQIESVDAALRQLAAKFDESVNRPTTVSLDPKPIEDLARRIESVRESLEMPQALAPRVERIETALDAMSEKLDRAQPAFDAHGINSTLAEMNSRLEEAFRRPAQLEIDPQTMEALAAQVGAVRESLERQAGQIDVGRLEEKLREAVEKVARPSIGPEEFRAIVAAIQALASKIDGRASIGDAVQEDLLERIAERVERFAVEPADIAALAGAIGDLAARVDRPAVDIARLEAIAAQASSRDEPSRDLSALIDMVSEIGAKLDRDAVTPQAERLHRDVAARLDALGAQLADLPAAGSGAHLETALRDLAERVADVGALADTRTIEQELRVLQEKLDDFADARMSSAFADQTAQSVARALADRLPGANPEGFAGQLHEIQDRLDAIASLRPAPAVLENAITELTEELEGLRTARDAVDRGAAALSEMRAAQLQFDRRMDLRFSGVQDILEKLVDRLDRDGAPVGRPAPAPAATRAAMLDIPDRDGDEGRLALSANPDASQIGAPSRARAEPDGAKAAAINAHVAAAHIAAARRAANAASAESDRRDDSGLGRGAGKNIARGWTKYAASLFQQNRRPVLIGAAGALVVLSGVAYEMRGHSLIRKSDLEAPASPLAAADMASTGAIASAPTVISAPLPPADAPAKGGPKPAAALVAELPASIGSALVAAASGGDIGAEIEIAQRYLEGRTVARDPRAAAAWLQAAADAGSPFAQYRLGALYEKGVGVARDAARATALYTQAADAGNTRAMHNLAVLYAQDGGTGKPDYVNAMKWFQKAATYGVRDSQFNLGVLYGRGLGAPQDLAQSWMWFSVGARQGDADAARKRDEVANRMDGRAMAAAQKLLDAFKAKTSDPAANEAPPAPAAAASVPADNKATGVKG